MNFAVRSPRDGAPAFSWPAFVATARSAIVVSSVSPLRCDTTTPKPAALGQRDRVERLGERADLVHLHEDRVGRALADPARQPLHVRHEQVVADDLRPSAERLDEPAPSLPVVLAERVLDRDDREAIEQVRPELDHVVGRPVGALEPVASAVRRELRGGRVHRERDLVARLEPGRLDRPEQQLERLGAGRQLAARSRPRRRPRSTGPCRGGSRGARGSRSHPSGSPRRTTRPRPASP